MIESLQLTNFKSWRDTGEMHFGDITGLFGTNSSGKSSILQFFLMLKETAESLDRTQVLDFGGEEDRHYVNLGSFQDVAHKSPYGQAESLSWHIKWSLPTKLTIANPLSRSAKKLFDIDRLTFSARIDRSARGPIVEQFMYRFDQDAAKYAFGMERQGNGSYHLVSDGYQIKRSSSLSSVPSPADEADTLPSYSDGLWPLPAPVKCYGFPDQVSAYNENAGFLNQFSLAFQNLMNGIYYLGPVREFPRREYKWAGVAPVDMGRRGESVVSALLASRTMPPIRRGDGEAARSVEEYVGHWLQQLGIVFDFTVDEIASGRGVYQLLVRQNKNSAAVPITDVGFGVSQVLPVLTLCYYAPEGSTILLEQPELHLHPYVQTELADVFIDAAKTRNLQIVIESHSEHLLSRLQRRMAEQAIDPDRFSLFFCTRDSSESQLEELRLDKFGNITNWPAGFFGDEFHERAEMMKTIARRMGAGAAV